MCAGDKAPTRVVPHILEFGNARNRLGFGEISNRVIAADREPWFVTPGHRSEQGHEQPEKRGRHFKRGKIILPHRLPKLESASRGLPAAFVTPPKAGTHGRRGSGTEPG